MPVIKGRMQFDHDDEGGEKAFYERRDELVEAFAGWLSTHGVSGDAYDVALLLDWKFNYGDSALDVWTVQDVGEFLLDWCPRKLSASPQDCAGLPGSVAAFVEFLAHHGMLHSRSQSVAQIRAYCERITGAFGREMGNPAKFGMAKSLFAGAGGSEPGMTPESLTEVLARLRDLPPDAVEEALARFGNLGPDDLDDLVDPPTLGPIRLPSDDERLAAVRAAPDLHRLRLLARWCPAPGQPLTAKGNLRLADARNLVEALGTADDPEAGTLTSATDLPHLTDLVETALAAGAVRRQKGRLVAVARFDRLSAVAAHEKVVRAVLGGGLDGRPATWASEPEHDPAVAALLAALIAAGDAGDEIDSVVELVTDVVMAGLGPLGAFARYAVPGRTQALLDRLARLHVVALVTPDEPCPECAERHPTAVLTAAGVPVAVDVAREAGFEVLLRPEPTTASASEIVDLLGLIDPDEWTADASAWFAAQPDRAVAATALVAAITAEDNETVIVAAGLTRVEQVLGEHAADAVRSRLEGPHDGLLVHWLLARSAIDPASFEPRRLTLGLLDLLTAALDHGGPDEVVASYQSADVQQQLTTLAEIWRLDHPGLADVLEAIGAHHPVKAVAKQARRSLMKYRSRVAAG